MNRKEEDNMKGFNEKWQRIFMAAAFAEEGEFETAREVLREKTKELKREMQSPRKTIRVSGPDIR
jgi:hypothetical protein